MSAEIIRPVSTEPAIARYLNQKGCMLGIPVSGNFELTARCNFNCKMCYVHLQNDVKELIKNELTTDQWLSIASDARDAGLLFLLLTGGEPFLRKDFAVLYREMRKMGMLVSVNTNASLYNEELRVLFTEHPPTRINVSLYGGSEDTYERLCGAASFEKVVQNIKRMKEDCLQVRLNVSLTPDNVKDMRRIHEISNELGLHAKATSYMYPPIRIDGRTGVNAGRFSAEEAGKVMADWSCMRDTKEQHLQRQEQIVQMRENSKKNPVRPAEPVLCRAGRSSFWMTWDGKMLPCGTMDIEPEEPLKIGFLKAWEGVRKKVSEIHLPEECANCKYRPMCGVCAANCKAETGCFYNKPEYLCQMVENQCDRILGGRLE